MTSTLPTINLYEVLTALPGDRPLLQYEQESLTAAELLERVEMYRQQQAAPSAFVLHAGNPVAALIQLIALDGVASQVFLVPESLAESDDFALLCERFSDYCSASGHKQSGATQWLLATSGTTGTPKLIAHDTASLTRALKHNPERGAGYRWGLVYEPFRFAGLQVLLQSLMAGSELIICHQLPFSEQLSCLRDAKVNALSATPTFWRKVLFHGGLEGTPLQQVTLGGEPVDQTLLDALRKYFPQARLTHIYAATETGVGFAVTDGHEGFPASWLQTGVRSSTGNTKLKETPDGTLALGRPEQMGGEFIDTGDRIERRGERIVFIGRLSGAINVGGNKVMPEEVELVIRQVPGVADVRVQGKGSSLVGELVSCQIVPTSDAPEPDLLKQAILETCRASLARFKVPALIGFTTELETNATGKLVRK
ncbi:AMP-binding protein [Nitrincola alkalilacustris]|uniref:AMP-binding protein n=1 Tax=Nitrincola alkalilacustris TaxID=1571224 RepID=UPI00124ED0E2|nr:class I adenylate-forming enzyme family protein [Nitrincola alkalilacustris]